MTKLPFAAIALAACLPLAAQEDHFTTSPEGYEFTEGNALSEDLLGTEPLLRYQQIDTTNTLSMANRNSIAFRRDGRVFPNPEYKARTIELELVFAESDLASISTTFASNYKTNQAVVFTRKQVSFASWILPPALPPATETNSITLDQGWSYFGKPATGNDFLWEVKVWSNSEAGKDYPFDFEYVVPNATFGTKVPTRGTATNLSNGCFVPGNPNPHQAIPVLLNHGNQFEFQYSSINGPASQAVVLFLDTANQNLSVPFLCNPLHAVALTTPIGVADAAGQFSMGALTIPHNPLLIGQKIVVQETRLCPGCYSPSQLDLSLSRGVDIDFPADPRDPAIGRVWALDPNAATATVGPLPGGIICYTNHL